MNTGIHCYHKINIKFNFSTMVAGIYILCVQHYYKQVALNPVKISFIFFGIFAPNLIYTLIEQHI
jgi:hypothetical protein